MAIKSTLYMFFKKWLKVNADSMRTGFLWYGKQEHFGAQIY